MEHLPLAQEIITVIEKGIPTPVLTVCGRGTQEIRFTRYLAYFLNPQKNHGLGASLLRRVLGHEADIFGLKTDWAEECSVEPEFWLGNYPDKSGRKTGCFSDIGIVGSDFAFVIEQKISSGEGPAGETGLSQLRRYSKVLEENPNPALAGKKVIKIYLTPSGREKRDIDNWLPISHLQIIERARQCLAETGISSVARENLRRLLIDLCLGPYDETEELISEIEDAAVGITGDPVSLQEVVKFRRLVENNRLLINLLLEGS